MYSIRRIYKPLEDSNAIDIRCWRLAVAIGYGRFFFELRRHLGVLHIGLGNFHIAMCWI